MHGDGDTGSEPATYDVIIVGGGAAGCVLAARLSEDRGVRVALIEAGADTPPGAVPADIADIYPRAYFNPAYFWPSLKASGRAGSSEAPYLQARIIGGGSSVMGMWAIRGSPADYDAWSDAGASGWGWNDVLPAFNRLERDLDYDGPRHGHEGPIPIRRHRSEVWPGFASRLAAAAGRKGLALREDINADFADGVFPVPVANDSDGRVSAAAGYLDARVRQRPNLSILAGAEAISVVLKGRVAQGVKVRRANVVEMIASRETILSAGAIGSPALLMRSGIGSAVELQALGIEPLLDLPGVGRELQNHCVVNLAMPIAARARQADSLRTYGLTCARLSSGHHDGRPGDLHLQFIARTSAYPHGDRLGIVGAALYAPLSRGAVTLGSADPGVLPRVAFRLLDHPADHARLASAIGFALGLLDDPAVAEIRGDVFAVAPNSLIRRLNRPSAFNYLVSAALAAILDAPEPLRRLALRRAGRVLPSPVSSTAPEDLLDAVTPIFHPAGTCKMGGSSDPAAVVDSFCRVRSIDGLRVVDASIMPSIPTGNTCLPTMMIAEHAAKFIASSQGRGASPR
jgi:5-(hydroxymethyl)furfural/furfural oxidase